MFPSLEDTLLWPFPVPMVAAGRGQYRRALRAAKAQHELTKDGSCYIISRRGAVIERIYIRPRNP